jgi:predicted nucleic acid-binding protein
VLNALRRLRAGDQLSEVRANDALTDFAELRIVRHAHVPLRRRIWDLRDRFTAYDASYVALAEILGAELVTGDVALADGARDIVAIAAT